MRIVKPGKRYLVKPYQQTLSKLQKNLEQAKTHISKLTFKCVNVISHHKILKLIELTS